MLINQFSSKRNISGFFTSLEGKQIVSKQKIDNFYTKNEKEISHV